MNKFVASLIICCLPIFALLGQSTIYTEVAVNSGINHLHVSQNYIGGGCAFFDYDNDGWLDIYLTGGAEMDALYHNQGDGSFIETTISAGLSPTGNFTTMGVVTGDINNDGYRDIFVTTQMQDSSLLFLNNGDGSFENISISAGMRNGYFSISASFGDINQDGYLDLYVGNYINNTGFYFDSVGQINGFNHDCFPNELYLNNTDNTFTEVSQTYSVDDTGCALATMFTDFDLDNDVDIHLANDFGEFIVPDQMFRNDYPLSSFANVSDAININSGIYGMGIAIGDYDEDLDFDYYISNLGRNVLHQNQGNGTFLDVTDSAGVANTYEQGKFVTSWGNGFLDYDNNSLIDLVVSNGNIPAAQFIATVFADPNKLYENNGDGSFTDISSISGINNTWINRGMAMGDYDNDGDIDLLFATLWPGNTQPYKALLYRNDGDSIFGYSQNNHVQFQLKSLSGNRDAFGSKIYLHAGGRTFLQEIDGGSSHASQHSSIAHFGLGTIATIDSVIVVWPGGISQTNYNFNINQLNIIEQDSSSACLQVMGLFTNAITENSAKFNWTDNGGDGYLIRGKSAGSQSFTYLSASKGTTSKKISNLLPGTTYIWQIQKICDSLITNNSWWSETTVFKTKCASPDSSWTDQITSNSARLNWSAVNGVDGYTIIGKPLSASRFLRFNMSASPTNFTAVGLKANTTYVWTVKAKCAPFSSNLGPIQAFTTNSTKQDADESNKPKSVVSIVYPNPNNGFFEVRMNSFEENDAIVIELYDLSGRKLTNLLDIDIENNLLKLNASKLSSGMYQLVIINNSAIYSEKIIIRK